MFNDSGVLSDINKALNPFIGVHKEIIEEYKKVGEIDFGQFLLYEDTNGFINITLPENETKIDGFLIFDSRVGKTV
jgi:hypothetical protein